jgi:hypothetical protein
MPKHTPFGLLADPQTISCPETRDHPGQLGCGGGQRQLRQALLIYHVDHPGHLADLRIRQPTRPKQFGNSRHAPQRLGDSDVLPRHTRGHRTTPGQPVRQRFEVVPIPDGIEGVEFAEQLQQHILGPGRIGCRSADPASQPTCIRALLLSSNQLRCRPVMDRYSLACIAARYHPRPVVIIHDQLLVLPREPFQIRKTLRISTDSSGVDLGSVPAGTPLGLALRFRLPLRRVRLRGRPAVVPLCCTGHGPCRHWYETAEQPGCRSSLRHRCCAATPDPSFRSTAASCWLQAPGGLRHRPAVTSRKESRQCGSALAVPQAIRLRTTA